MQFSVLFDAVLVRRSGRLLGVGLPVEAVREPIDCIHATDRLEPCAVPLLVGHIQAYDGRIAKLTSTRDAL